MAELLSRIWFTLAVALCAANIILLTLHASSVSALGQEAAAAGDTFTHTTHSLVGTTGKSVDALGHGLHSGVDTSVRVLGTGMVTAVQAPFHLIVSVTALPGIRSLIHPADHSHFASIQPMPHVVLAASIVAPSPVNSGATAPRWPIHGTITQFFGVPEWPFAPWHTGIDISDGMPSGITPLYAYRPGRVVEATRFSSGYGIHVIIDHGDGITSVYGHMARLNVQVGQLVDESTIIGYEGRTGTATGVHLHFELRLNGRPVNPLLYVPGRP